MNPLLILEDALKSGKDFGSLAGKLRDKFKSGVSDLQAIFDEAETVVDKAVAKAKDGLAAFKTEVSKVEGEITDVGSEMPSEVAPAAPTAPVEPAPAPEPVAPVVSEAPSGAMVTVDAAKGTTEHESTDGTVTTVLHDGSPATAMKDGEDVPPAPEHVAEAINATTESGISLPASAEVAAPEAAPVI